MPVWFRLEKIKISQKFSKVLKNSQKYRIGCHTHYKDIQTCNFTCGLKKSKILKISQKFSKCSQNVLKMSQKFSNRLKKSKFLKISQKFSKISQKFSKKPKNVSKMQLNSTFVPYQRLKIRCHTHCKDIQHTISPGLK